LYDLFASIVAKRYASDIEEATLEDIKEMMAFYRNTYISLKQIAEPVRFNNIEFSVPSVTGGPDHFSASLKNHGQISLDLTRYSDSKFNKTGYVVAKSFPGNHAQSARMMFETEVGESLIIAHKKKATPEQMLTTMATIGPSVLEGLSHYKPSRFADFEEVSDNSDVETQTEEE